MTTLKDEHRRFIIEMFAAFSTLDEIEKALQDVYGLPVPKSTILRHNPDTVQGKAELGAQWKTLFADRRKHFLEDLASIPIASAAYRLGRLQKIIDDPVKSKSPPLVMDALEQAAKEMGGVFTNKRDVTSNGETLAVIGIEVVQPATNPYGKRPGGTDAGSEDSA